MTFPLVGNLHYLTTTPDSQVRQLWGQPRTCYLQEKHDTIVMLEYDRTLLLIGYMSRNMINIARRLAGIKWHLISQTKMISNGDIHTSASSNQIEVKARHRYHDH